MSRRLSRRYRYVRHDRWSGAIKAFRAEVDLAALGRPLEAMIAVRYLHTFVYEHVRRPVVEILAGAGEPGRSR
jgi:hypothetical protein